MITAYIAHQLSAPTREGIEQNRRNAAKWAVWALRQGFAPSCSWIVLTGELEETPENRKLGLEADCATVALCGVMLLCGPRITAGIATEAGSARSLLDFTHLGHDVPPDDLSFDAGRVMTLADVELLFAATQAAQDELPTAPFHEMPSESAGVG